MSGLRRVTAAPGARSNLLALDRRDVLAGLGVLAASAVLPLRARALEYQPLVIVLAEDWPATEKLADLVRGSRCLRALLPMSEEPAVFEFFDLYAPEAMICGVSAPEGRIITVQAGLYSYGYKNGVYAYRTIEHLPGEVDGEALRAVLARLMEQEYGIHV